MAVYTIGDLHLALGTDKPMDIFPGWEGYLEKLTANWRTVVLPQDTVVIPGDVSWAMSLAGALADFSYLDALPGQKLILKGNHDYWWTTVSKMERFFVENGYSTLAFIHNGCVARDGLALCGTRGWCFEDGGEEDARIMAREAGRLERSLQAAHIQFPELERVVFLHYPPISQDTKSEPLLDVMRRYDVKRCYYAHLHGYSIKAGFQGEVDGVTFRLASADGLGFMPLRVG